MSKKGLFIVVDGIDGSGKSTVAQYLSDKLDGVVISSLGHGPISSKIRQRYLDPDKEHDPIASLNFMLTAHLETYVDYVKPLTESGRTVIVDRWLWTTYAYNVFELAPNALQISLFEAMLRSQSPLSNLPDISFYCYVNQNTANQRIAERGDKNRLDDYAAHKKLRIFNGFEDIVRNSSTYSDMLRLNGKTSHILNCNMSKDEVLEKAYTLATLAMDWKN